MRRFALLAFLLCGAWDPVTRPQPDVAAGNKGLAAGKLPEAEGHYKKALEALPGHAGVLFDLGAAHYAEAQALPKGADRVKLLDAAEKEFRLAGDAPDTKLRSSAHYNLGNALFQQDKFKEAVEEYKKSLKLDPSREDARKNLELALVRIPPPPPPQPQPQKGQDDKQKPQPQDQQQQQQQAGSKDQQQQDQKDPQQQQQDPKDQKDPQQQQQPQPQDQQQKPQDQQQQDQQQQQQQQQAGAEPRPTKEAGDEDLERKLDALERRSGDLQISKARERARQRQRGKVVKDW
jgi:tetratricopeptide (TPR) repeat protein